MNFIDAKLDEENGVYYAVFGQDRDTYRLKLPESKNRRDCLKPYIDKDIILGIRPEHIHDEPELLEKHADGLLKADVEVTELMGAEIYLYVNVVGNAITARVDSTSKARSGDKIKMAIDMTRVHIFDKETEQTISN